jgi:hypothetical protein
MLCSQKNEATRAPRVTRKARKRGCEVAAKRHGVTTRDLSRECSRGL